MYKFTRVASDGQWTIGYDADEVPGIVPGNSVDSFSKKSDFQPVDKGHCFDTSNELFIAEEEYDEMGNKRLFWNYYI